MSALRIGLLGAGAHAAQNHGPSWRDFVARNPGVVELVGVCDLDERRATEYASRFGFAGVHTDLDRLLDEGLDGLVAITPMDLTESVATKALEAGSLWSSKNHPVSALKARSDCSASQDRRGQNTWSPSIAVLCHL